MLQDTATLLEGLSAASPLTSGTAAAFVAIIDAVAVASHELAAAAASGGNATVPSATDTLYTASVEETTKVAADAVVTVLEGIGSGLAAGLGEGEATSLHGATFVLSVQRTSTDAATSSDEAVASLAADDAREAPAAALVTSSLRRRLASSYNVPAALTAEAARGAPPVFLVSSAMSALEALDEVSLQTVEVTASNTLRQPPAPNGTELSLLASSVASLSLLDATGAALVVTNATEPILMALSATFSNLTTISGADASSNDTSGDCRTLIDTAATCEAEAEALEAAVTAKQAECNELPAAMVGDKAAAIDACSQELQALWDEHTAKAVECGRIALPCNGESRGECSLDDGVCACVNGWMGIECEQRPQCMYVDAAGDWSADACELVSVTAQGDDVFAVVCACTSAPHEYAVVTTVVTAADAFFTAVTPITVTLAGPLGWEDLVSTLEKSVSTSAPAIILSVLALLVGLLVAVWYDDRHAYTSLYPTWHECLSCHASQSAAWRAVGASVVYVLSNHHLCFVFLALPTLPATKAQRLMTAYNVVLVQLAVLILYWGSTNSGAAAAWAQLIDVATVLLVKNLLVWLFMRGAQRKADYDTETAKAASSHLHAAEHKQWHLMMRQTAPKRHAPPSAMQRFAAAWRGEGPLLLGEDVGAPNYFDALAARRDLDLYRDAQGRLTFKMVTYHRVSATTKGKGKGRAAMLTTKDVTTWRQLSGLDEWRVRGFTPLHYSNDETVRVFGGLHRSGAPAGGKASGEPMPGARMRGGKCDESGNDLYVLGEPRLNELGGITTWGTTAEASAFRVEIFLLNPHYRSFHPSLPHHYIEVPHHLKKLHRKHLPKALMVKMGPRTTRLAKRLGWKETDHAAPKPMAVRALTLDGILDERKEAAVDEELLRRSRKGRAASGQHHDRPASDVRRHEGGGEGVVVHPITLERVVEPHERVSFSAVRRAFLVHTLADVPESALIQQADGSVGFFAQYDPLTLAVSSTLRGGATKKAETTDDDELAQLEKRFEDARKALTKRSDMEVNALEEEAEREAEDLDATAVEARRARMRRAVDQVHRRLATALHQLEEDHKNELDELKHTHHRRRWQAMVPKVHLHVPARKPSSHKLKLGAAWWEIDDHHHRLHNHDQITGFTAAEEVAKDTDGQASDEEPSEGEYGTDDEDPPPQLVVKAARRAIRRWVRLGDELRELQPIKARAAAAAQRAADALSAPARETHTRYVEEIEEINDLRSALQTVATKKSRRAPRALGESDGESASRVDLVTKLRALPVSSGGDEQYDEDGHEQPMPHTAEGVGAWWEDLSEVQKQAVALRHLQALDARLEAVEAAQQGAMARLEARATQQLRLIQAEYEADVARLKAAFAKGGSRVMAPKPRPQWVRGLLAPQRLRLLAANGSKESKISAKAIASPANEAESSQQRDSASWPHFIPVLTMRRVRPLPGSCKRSNAADSETTKHSSETTYIVTYKDDAANHRKITADQLVTMPMVVHRRLAMQYQRRRVEGWPHEDAMAELREHCGLPVVWRGCRPFTGGFDQRRLLVGWALSWCVFVFSLALLIYDWLSQRNEIPFGSVFGTFALSTFVLPIVEFLLKLGAMLLLDKMASHGRNDGGAEIPSTPKAAATLPVTPAEEPPAAAGGSTASTTSAPPTEIDVEAALEAAQLAMHALTSSHEGAPPDILADRQEPPNGPSPRLTPPGMPPKAKPSSAELIVDSREEATRPKDVVLDDNGALASVHVVSAVAATEAEAAEYYPPVVDTESPTESSDELLDDEEAAMVSEGLRALAGSFHETVGPPPLHDAPRQLALQCTTPHPQPSPPPGRSAQVDAVVSWLASSTSSSPQLLSASSLITPAESNRSERKSEINSAAVQRSRQAAKARRSSPAASAAAALMEAQGVPAPAPRPPPEGSSTALVAYEPPQPPAVTPAPYRPSGAAAAARRQLRAGSVGRSRGGSSAAMRRTASAGGVRPALRPTGGPSARPPPRCAPPRERHAIDLSDLQGLSRAHSDGAYDPRLAAHRWLRGILTDPSAAAENDDLAT